MSNLKSIHLTHRRGCIAGKESLLLELLTDTKLEGNVELFSSIFMMMVKKMRSSEIKVIPSLIPTIYEVQRRFQKAGIDEEDLILMVQRRTKPQQSKKAIRAALKGLRQVEKLIVRSYREYQEEYAKAMTLPIEQLDKIFEDVDGKVYGGLVEFKNTIHYAIIDLKEEQLVSLCGERLEPPQTIAFQLRGKEFCPDCGEKAQLKGEPSLEVLLKID